MNRSLIYFEESIKSECKTMYAEIEGKKKYIISKYNPLIEAERIVAKYEGNKETLWIVLGYCMGYLVDELLRVKGEDTHILIVDHDLEGFKEQIEINKKLSEEIFKKENVHVCVSHDLEEISQVIAQKVRLQNAYNMEVLSYPTYCECNLDYYKQIIHILSQIRVEIILDKNTIQMLTDQVLKNNLINCKYLVHSYDIRQHKGKYPNVPALVVSAGPSLNKNIHHLKNFRGIIFVVGRALDAVLKQEVKPHFVVTIDPQDITYDTFQGHTQTDIPLIAVPSANPRLIRESKGPIYFTEYMANELFDVELEDLPMGGSVATLCASAGVYMGCNPIIFIGQDLAYTGMKYHAEDCVIKGTINITSENDEKLKIVKGYYNDKVYSEDTLLSYKKWFEGFIRTTSEVKFINATEGGVFIEGADHMSFAEAINNYCNDEKFAIQHIDQIKIKTSTEEGIQKNREQFNVLKDKCKEALNYAKKLNEEYVRYKGMRQHKIDNILLKMDKIDQVIMELEKNEIILSMFNKHYNQYCIDSKYYEPLNEKIYEKGIRVSELNCRLYQSLIDGSNEMIQLIDEFGVEEDIVE